ncbi:histone-lysine N-methyltransferase SETMAR [Notothenia coriiceps]|uniref:Histone-lysine N-methyltransferase SETMAR n=1 Tax=Notothenia coriiceps TaxID=8208 RepID=A0A6I9N057_9TELE|nr:PREDICTED: histone-lysine N-methyltransferase SETMAR [Notothenia coriiceps]
MSSDSIFVDLSNSLESVPVLIEQRSSVLTFPQFQYSPDNVQGPGCTLDPSEVTLPGCSCLSHSCSSESCSCLQTHGQAYDSTHTLLHRTHSGFCSPVFECNALCSCGDACSNRVVQSGLTLKLEVYSTEKRGWGVRALKSIPKGTFVCEYAGEVISFEEARRRQLAQRAEDNNYIIAVREHAGEGSVTETFVDPARVGNVGRFLNHSCQPNLLMQPVRVHSVVPRLALFAGRSIDALEELTFDYSGGYRNRAPAQSDAGTLSETQSDAGTQSETQSDAGTQSDAETQRDAGTQSDNHGVQRKECHCGAKSCVQFLPLDLSIISGKR